MGDDSLLMPEEEGQDPAILLVLARRQTSTFTHSYPTVTQHSATPNIPYLFPSSSLRSFQDPTDETIATVKCKFKQNHKDN